LLGHLPFQHRIATNWTNGNGGNASECYDHAVAIKHLCRRTILST
jgi:hypothetical protein